MVNKRPRFKPVVKFSQRETRMKVALTKSSLGFGDYFPKLMIISQLMSIIYLRDETYYKIINTMNTLTLTQ